MKQLQLRKTISKIFKISSERERGIKQKLTALGKEAEEKSKAILETQVESEGERGDCHNKYCPK